ncbi:histone-lysine N-methyltransferase eggless [Anopheles cruzii]|uniref:histone-lysine N-methyltransferase eggless n=1 Tax=Anopheles cruzii TaxID=68878 RepID=UPI0022EC50DF|nr:histone-lysine N-methyltransferase eggless [Anopheles cruzii]
MLENTTKSNTMEPKCPTPTDESPKTNAQTKQDEQCELSEASLTTMERRDDVILIDDDDKDASQTSKSNPPSESVASPRATPPAQDETVRKNVPDNPNAEKTSENEAAQLADGHDRAQPADKPCVQTEELDLIGESTNENGKDDEQSSIVANDTDKPEDVDKEVDIPAPEEDTVKEAHDIANVEKVAEPDVEKSTNDSNGTVKEKEITETATFECCNTECPKLCTEFIPATMFAMKFYDTSKKKRKPYVCNDCFESCVHHYETLCSMMLDHQPLAKSIRKAKEFVEISDSSDEEDEKEIFQGNEAPVPENIISFMESELMNVLGATLKNTRADKQVNWTMSAMKKNIEKNKIATEKMETELRDLQRSVDTIFRDLYSSKQRYETRLLPDLHIINGEEQMIMLRRPAPESKQTYYGLTEKLPGIWQKCSVVKKVLESHGYAFWVQFPPESVRPSNTTFNLKLHSATHLAYLDAPDVKLQTGTRVIAKIRSRDKSDGTDSRHRGKDSFYAGIVAEPVGLANNYRYLVFYDDGYAQYINQEDVRVVCEQSENVWDDVAELSRNFIKTYLENYTAMRVMVQVKPGQRLRTELNGKWHATTVVEIDCSLIKLQFQGMNHTEWIYRGSRRLEKMYFTENPRQQRNAKFSKLQKRNEPSIEYIITIDDDKEEEKVVQKEKVKKELMSKNEVLAGREEDGAKQTTSTNVADATVTRPRYMNQNIIYCDNDKPEGTVSTFPSTRFPEPKRYTPHTCNRSCLYETTYDLRVYSFLGHPLLCGWERQLCTIRNRKSIVVYRAPCGRRLRSMDEVHRYLRRTKAKLNVDNFDFDPEIRVLAEYRMKQMVVKIPDLSNGLEYTPVSCVNAFDDTKPPPCDYSVNRIPTEGVNLNLNPEFMSCCDCEDDCFDKSKCQCWQLTITGARFLNPKQPIDSIGYIYKRLPEPVLTGIYECNSRCKCKKNCLNRVVQHPLLNKLQIFRTNNRGWGIRCLNDIPKGSFICHYSGHLITEDTGNMICAEDIGGDEYFADLDYIETVENAKEGYESDVSEMEPESNDGDYEESNSSPEDELEVTNSKEDSDEDFTINSTPSNRAVTTRSQLRPRKTTTTTTTVSLDDTPDSSEPEATGENRVALDDTPDSSEPEATGKNRVREPMNFMPRTEMSRGDRLGQNGDEKKPLRSYFGANEAIYIMDAKKSGNLGRYFNHSCSPNLFVQNVFVDTHDVRFPWVAFFADKSIKAGSELTWNYNYDIGSVPGKVLYCHCGEKECRKRLL